MNEEEIMKTVTIASIHARLSCAYELLSHAYTSFELIEDESSTKEISVILEDVYKLNVRICADLMTREKELNKACGNY